MKFLTTPLAILMGSVLIALSIIYSSGSDTQAGPSISPASIKRQISAAIKKEVQDGVVIESKKRKLATITVSDLRYAAPQDRIIATVSTTWEEPTHTLNASVSLSNNGWNQYSGNMRIGNQSISISIQ